MARSQPHARSARVRTFSHCAAVGDRRFPPSYLRNQRRRKKAGTQGHCRRVCTFCPLFKARSVAHAAPATVKTTSKSSWRTRNAGIARAALRPCVAHNARAVRAASLPRSAAADASWSGTAAGRLQLAPERPRCRVTFMQGVPSCGVERAQEAVRCHDGCACRRSEGGLGCQGKRECRKIKLKASLGK